jgi:glycosyltransferase involved in cell wall biosynthesis
MKDLTLVIPAKNEAESLPVVLNELKNIEVNKIVVLPEGDNLTLEAIKNFDVKIIYQKGKGFGNALKLGITSVDTKYFCIFNADGSFDPIYLNELRNILINGSDFVFSSRYLKNGGSEDDTFLTFIGNKFFTTFCNLLFKLNISDVLYTYVMGSTKAYKSLNMIYDDFSFCVELPIKAKLKNYILTHSPSFERSRIAGVKKVNEFKDGFLILISILKLLKFKK